MRMRKTLITLLFISVLAARQPIVYFYVIPFDNLKDDPTIEWISSGLSDMVSNKFKNEPGLLIQNKQDLEVIMNDRSLMLKQPIASRNLLLLGKYSRQLEKINISVQLIDLATWEQMESKDIAAEYSDISKMKSSVAENIRSMISSYLPNKSGGVSVVLPKFIEPNPVPSASSNKNSSNSCIASCNTHITTLSFGSMTISPVGVITIFSLTIDPIIVSSGRFASLRGMPTNLELSFT